jgi:hypothetical protein
MSAPANTTAISQALQALEHARDYIGTDEPAPAVLGDVLDAITALERLQQTASSQHLETVRAVCDVLTNPDMLALATEALEAQQMTGAALQQPAAASADNLACKSVQKRLEVQAAASGAAPQHPVAWRYRQILADGSVAPGYWLIHAPGAMDAASAERGARAEPLYLGAAAPAAAPRVDALLAKWGDDGASRGPAFIELRDLARELEGAAAPAAAQPAGWFTDAQGNIVPAAAKPVPLPGSAAAQPAIPPGFALVPAKATGAMVDAAHDGWDSNDPWRFVKAYQAMLAAAPQAPAAAQPAQPEPAICKSLVRRVATQMGWRPAQPPLSPDRLRAVAFEAGMFDEQFDVTGEQCDKFGRAIERAHGIGAAPGTEAQP